MLKRIFWLAALAAICLGVWRFGYPAALKYFFRLSGTVEVAGELNQALPGQNSTLFLIALNENGVPVAVKKIINPTFPAKFDIGPSSLIMPDLLTSKLYLEAKLNSHGQLGLPRRGDLKGIWHERINIRQSRLRITLTETEK